MSTKTLRKRIALVAVSALGFGLLSVAPSNAATASISVTGIARAGVGMQLTVTGDDITDSTSVVHFVKTGTLPSGGSLTTDFGAALTAGTSTIEIVEDAVGGDVFVPGTYNLLVWVNSTAGSQVAPAAGNVFTRVAVTVAGVPASISLTAPTAAASASTTTNAKFVASLKDANGVNTLLGTNESVTVKPTYSVGVVEIGATNGAAGSTLVTASTTALGALNSTASGTLLINNYTFYLDNSLATSTTVAVAGAGLLAGITGASASLSTIAKTYPTLVHINGGSTYSTTSLTAGNTLAAGAYAQATDAAAAANVAITASTVDAKSLTFRLTGTPAQSFDYTVAATSTTVALPTGITAGTYTTDAIATGATTVDFTITATAAAAASGYKVTIPMTTTTNLVYTITYEAPVVGGNYGTVTMSPTTAKAAKALIGSAVTVTATVKDQFGKAYAGANVVWSGTGYNTIAASNATSDASGKASLTFTDAKTTGGAQAFSAVATAPTQTAGVTGTTTITFGSAATVAVDTLTLTSNKAAATVGNLIDAVITETVVVKDANGAFIQGIPVTMSISSNGYAVSTTLTEWTDTNGAVAMTFAGKTVGTATVTATAGGKSATDAIVVITDTTKSRTISLSDAAVAITGGDTKKITATVRDGYGNAVSGQTLNVSLTGTAGRISAVNGVIGASGTTAADGTLVVDVTAALTETGTATLTVAGTMGITSTTLTLNTDGVTPMPALVKSTTATATMTASNAAALAAAAAATTAAADNKKILDAVAAIAAKAASDKAESDAKIKLLEAQIAAAAVKAAADTAAAQAAAVAAAEAAADAAAEAIDAGNNANDSANAAAEAADAATAAAQQAGEDAVAAAEAAGAAAVAAAQSAQDAAAEATDAATAATDAANAAAEAADAATAAAQDAADAVAALSVQVTEVVASLKKQITALTNLVIRIQKKVKA